MMFRPLGIASAALLAANIGAQNAKPSTPAASDAIPESARKLLPPPAPFDTGHIQAKVGSFKMLPMGEDLPSGKLDLSFTGTVLVTKLAPGSYLKTYGNVHQEYNNEKYGKQVYFGTGRIVIAGKFSNLQWFGRDMNMSFKGKTFIRVIAEYDNELKTGFTWFDGAPKTELPNSMTGFQIPRVGPVGNHAMTREEFEKAKKKGGG